ncbi:MAG: hypothetical protein ABUL60_31010 [Myxococcales bacterium]
MICTKGASTPEMVCRVGKSWDKTWFQLVTQVGGT